ncbi:MAG: T9SS type A sorting domain-containing protein [Bacteroidales bacterium]|nr:T9SS type A sorting domain-containing protein [Bacteroidales bacterium]
MNANINIFQLRIFAILFFLISSVIFRSCFAQNEASIWYFGHNAGVDFSSGMPVAITNGEIYTSEGSSCISDEYGNVLFYTDGITVWNKIHDVMDNGTGLAGGSSSTQSALIIKKPASESIYYIFTMPTYIIAESMCYSVVDLTINNGLGKIINKNIFLRTPMTERVTAVHHSNDTDIWVISHEEGSDAFCSFLVSPSGVSHNPVISNVGIVHQDPFYNMGYLKASPKGSYIAYANSYMDYAELFDFDNSTGEVSNPVTFYLYGNPYGVEFSSNESRLYTSLMDDKRVLQYDLTAGSALEIINSKKDISGTLPRHPCALQLGPDLKIYIVQLDSYLSVINNPNELDTNCNFAFSQISLQGRLGRHGLPNFFQSYFTSATYYNINYEDTCFGDTTYFEINPLDSTQTVLWNFGDTASGGNNTSTLPNPGHLFTGPGLFTITATVLTDTVSQDYTTDVTIDPLPDSTIYINGTDSVCQGTNNVLYEIAPIANADSIIWRLIPDTAGNIIGNDTIIYINFSPSFSGQAILSTYGSNSCGNGDSATYNIDVIGTPIPNAGLSALICQNTNYTLSGSALNYSVTIWVTTGDGNFDDPFMLDATYSPGSEDIINGDVYLLLRAFAISPCVYAKTDTMLLTIKKMPYQPQTPIGPTFILMDTSLNSEYYTNSIENAIYYQWHLNPVEAGVINGVDTIAAVQWNGNYTGLMAYINVEAVNNCGGVSSDTLNVNLSPVGSEVHIVNEAQIIINPNPSSGIFNISITSANDDIDLTVINSNGLIIQQKKIHISGNNNTFKLNLSDQPSGIYYLRFVSNGTVQLKKVLVNRNY